MGQQLLPKNCRHRWRRYCPRVQTVAEGEQLLAVALGQQAWGLATQVLKRLAPLGTAAQQQAWYEQSARGR